MLSPFQDVEDEMLVDLEQIENSNHDNDESLPRTASRIWRRKLLRRR
jgi:hypothetical protein